MIRDGQPDVLLCFRIEHDNRLTIWAMLRAARRAFLCAAGVSELWMHLVEIKNQQRAGNKGEGARQNQFHSRIHFRTSFPFEVLEIFWIVAAMESAGRCNASSSAPSAD